MKLRNEFNSSTSHEFKIYSMFAVMFENYFEVRA